MIFAYTVGEEETAEALEDALKTRISSKNYGINEIVLTWASTSANKITGYFDESNVAGVLIENDLLISGNTRFSQVGTFQITPDATLTIANDVVLRIADNANVIINGVLKANNHAWLKGDAKISGLGTVYVESANVAWSKTAAWRGTWHE